MMLQLASATVILKVHSKALPSSLLGLKQGWGVCVERTAQEKAGLLALHTQRWTTGCLHCVQRRELHTWGEASLPVLHAQWGVLGYTRHAAEGRVPCVLFGEDDTPTLPHHWEAGKGWTKGRIPQQWGSIFNAESNDQFRFLNFKNRSPGSLPHHLCRLEDRQS